MSIITTAIKGKLQQAMIIIAMIFWTIVVQKSIAMIIMLVRPYLDKFIKKIIHLSFQTAHGSFHLMMQVKKIVSWIGSSVERDDGEPHNFEFWLQDLRTKLFVHAYVTAKLIPPCIPPYVKSLHYISYLQLRKNPKI